MLRAYPGLSGADLARVALLTPQTVGVIIRNLERDGAIRKIAAPGAWPGAAVDADAARCGALLDQCRRRAQAMERRLMAGLSAKAQVTVRRWLPKSPQICSRIAGSRGALTFAACLCRAARLAG